MADATLVAQLELLSVRHQARRRPAKHPRQPVVTFNPSLIMMPSLSPSKVGGPRGHSGHPCVLHSLDKLHALDQAARSPAADLDDFYDGDATKTISDDSDSSAKLRKDLIDSPDSIIEDPSRICRAPLEAFAKVSRLSKQIPTPPADHVGRQRVCHSPDLELIANAMERTDFDGEVACLATWDEDDLVSLLEREQDISPRRLGGVYSHRAGMPTIPERFHRAIA